MKDFFRDNWPWMLVGSILGFATYFVRHPL